MLQDPRAVPYLMDTLSRQDSAFGKMYAGLWPRFSRSWQKRLPPPSHAVYARRYAAFVLRFYESSARAAVPVLIRALRDPDALVRTHAAGSLASLGEGNPASIAGLLGTLNDTNARVRSVAAAALVHLGQKDSNVVAALKAGLSDPNPSIRSYTSNALWRLTTESKSGAPASGGPR
jgi:HEAT repeat protein